MRSCWAFVSLHPFVLPFQMGLFQPALTDVHGIFMYCQLSLSLTREKEVRRKKPAPVTLCLSRASRWLAGLCGYSPATKLLNILLPHYPVLESYKLAARYSKYRNNPDIVIQSCSPPVSWLVTSVGHRSESSGFSVIPLATTAPSVDA
jgi:hypothetical protein